MRQSESRKRLSGRRILSLVFAIGVVCLMSTEARAGEEPEHYHLVYTLARAVGFNHTEAQLIASASWSVDTNADTTAFQVARGDVQKTITFFATNYDPKGEPGRVASSELFSEGGFLHHAPLGVMFHALAGEEDRSVIDTYWKQIVGGARDTDRLILTGMYLHFVVDRFCHPGEAIVGHFFDGHGPDRAINHPTQFTNAAIAAIPILTDARRNTGSGKDIAGRTPDQRLRIFDANTTEGRHKFASEVVSAIADAYLEKGYSPLDRRYENAAADWKTPNAAIDLNRVASVIKSRVESSFDAAGEKFDVDAPLDLKYTATKSGEMTVSGLRTDNAAYHVPNPAAALSSGSAGPLAAARQHLVDEVKGYSFDTVVTAASHAVETSPPANMGLVPGMGISKAIGQEALAILSRLTTNEGTVYGRTAQGGLRIYQRTSDGTTRVWERAGDTAQLTELRGGQVVNVYTAPVRTLASRTLLQGQEERVGGVRLAYACNVLDALTLRAGANESTVVNVQGSVRLLSLKALLSRLDSVGGEVGRLDESAAFFGGISRIVGYIVDRATADVIVIGTTVSGATGIPIEDVSTAMQTVYRDGRVPSISLDPDISNPGGPQTVRIGGVPTQSHFARVMAEADYAMKKIMFGLLPAQSAGFISHYDLLKATPDPKPGQNRFWLSPVPPGPSDIQMAPTLDEALFSAGMEVLTESEEISSFGLKGTGSVDTLAQEAAHSFTTHYGDIARQYPIFRSLQGLNDLVLLATVLRKAEVKEPVLERLSSTTLKSTNAEAAPKWYPGISRIVRDEVLPGAPGRQAQFVLSGGVRLRNAATKGLWARYDDQQLATLREQARRLAGSGDLTLDTGLNTLIVSAPRGAPDHATLAIEAGTTYLTQGKFADAAEAFSRAITSDQYATEAFVGRAMAEAALETPRSALRDLRKAKELEPDDEQIQATEFAINIETGRDLLSTSRPETLPANVRSQAVDGLLERGLANHSVRRYSDAIRDFSYALDIQPQQAKVYMYRGAVETDMGNFQPASDDLDQALRLEPNLVEAHIQRSRLRILRHPGPDYLGAVLDATAAIRLEPDNPLAYTARATARIAAEREFPEALADASKLIRLAPEFGVGYCIRAQVEWMTGDSAGAERDAAQARTKGLDECKRF